MLTILTPEGVELRLTLAGPASRFASALIDLIIQVVLLFCLGLVLNVLGTFAPGGTAVVLAVWAAISFGLITFYDVFFEVLNSGRTPGKRLNGLRVVRVEGHPVTFVTSCIRNVLRPIDFLPSAYLVGVVSILATRKNQRIGDVVAGTLVVRELTGGRRKKDEMPSFALFAPPVPSTHPSAAAWDTTRVTAEELATVRQFLERREGIEMDARRQLAATLAERLRPKVAGAPADLRGEQFLATLLAAKRDRGAG